MKTPVAAFAIIAVLCLVVWELNSCVIESAKETLSLAEQYGISASTDHFSNTPSAEEVKRARELLQSATRLNLSLAALLRRWSDMIEARPAAPTPVAPSAADATAPGDRSAAPTIPEKSRASSIGPGFDCTKAAQPLPRLICSNPELSRTDLLFNQAYQALRQQLVPAGQRQLAQDDLEFLDYVKRFCGVPDAGAVAGSSGCVGAQYDRKRSEWLSRLSGPAREEANRPIERHVALQGDLQRLGFLPATTKIDGVYSAATRAAIVAWQHANGRPATGLIGDADAAALGGAAPLARAATLPAPGLSSSQQIAAGCDPSDDVHLPQQLSLAEKLEKFPADLIIAADTRVVTGMKDQLSHIQSDPEWFANATAFHRAQCGVNSVIIGAEDELKALKMLPPSPPIALQLPRKINGVYVIPTIPCQMDLEHAPFFGLSSYEITWPAGHKGDVNFKIQEDNRVITLIMNSLAHPGVDSDGQPDAVEQATLNDPVAHAHSLCFDAYLLRALREEIAVLEKMKARPSIQ